MPTDRALLAPYCTNLERPVFALRNLPEEVVAVLFAYYSRSTDSLRDNLARLLADGDLALPGGAPDEAPEGLAAAQEKARQFHEKWVVGYGHSSVAEHAVVHLAVEDVSIVATKVIEDCRLASFTEKSTRYVPFDGDSFVRDPAVVASGLLPVYEAACRSALETYSRLLPVVEAQVVERFACPPDWPARRYASTVRAKACDLLRYLLPAATRTNLGLTCNARLLEHLLTKLYSHPLGELRELAAALQREATAIVPTLIKYAAPNAYQQQTRAAVAALATDLPAPTPTATASSNLVRLVRAPDDPVGELATAILYEAAHLPYGDLRAQVAALPAARQQAIVDAYLADRGRWDAPLRALELVSYTFEVLLDYGAYRDIQRHRMCTQTAQTLTTHHGYETPPELLELGHGAAYDAVMAQSAAAWATLAAAVGEERAQYVLPLAWRKRLLLTCNLRELHHFISLRSGRQGHVSYRRVAQDCWHELHRVHPALAAAVRVDLAEYALARG
ncbi:MAG: FAD-dependent thymidylate synthase [Fimbriimonadaceae bacterium]|nr:FAD-dependent thymidylate synthase [Fimbriimonadaceae bacterium]